MPVYRWDVIAAQDFRWLRERARRGADLYDGYRIDHLVGFYRTFGRPRDGSPPFFTPAAQLDQELLGERVLDLFRSAGAEIIAEDLGTVPDFVRGSLARIGVPGFRVMRWERQWHAEDSPSATRPLSAVSVAPQAHTTPNRCDDVVGRGAAEAVEGAAISDGAAREQRRRRQRCR